MTIRDAILTGDLTQLRARFHNKAELNAVDEAGWTPLHLSVATSRYDVVRLLLTLGANAEVQDVSGRTPVDYARMRSDSHMIKLLRGNASEMDAEAPG